MAKKGEMGGKYGHLWERNDLTSAEQALKEYLTNRWNYHLIIGRDKADIYIEPYIQAWLKRKYG